MKHLESQELDLHKDVAYECFTIPYVYVYEGHDRTYRCDFYVEKWKRAFEVKPAYVLRDPLIQQSKWDAASELLNGLGIKFEVVTEKDFTKIVFATAMTDSDVEWKEETFKY